MIFRSILHGMCCPVFLKIKGRGGKNAGREIGKGRGVCVCVWKWRKYSKREWSDYQRHLLKDGNWRKFCDLWTWHQMEMEASRRDQEAKIWSILRRERAAIQGWKEPWQKRWREEERMSLGINQEERKFRETPWRPTLQRFMFLCWYMKS